MKPATITILLSEYAEMNRIIDRQQAELAALREQLGVFGADRSNIQADMSREIASLREQLKHAETERDALCQTYDKTVERLEREIARLNNLPLVRKSRSDTNRLTSFKRKLLALTRGAMKSSKESRK